MKREAVALHCTGLSLDATAKRLGASARSVMRWVISELMTGVRGHAREHCPKPEPVGRAGDLPRKRRGGRTRRGPALRPKKASKLWIRKALERGTGRLIDWERGGRDAATSARSLRRLGRVRLSRTDDWAPCAAALSAGRRHAGKDLTRHTESNNARQRHWFARFRRRTCAVSESAAIVEATSGAALALLPRPCSPSTAATAVDSPQR